MTSHAHATVIVGAGQAAAQAAQSLRAGGYAGSIVMLGEEAAPPYQRPPLSKAYLSGAMGLDRVVLKPLEAWAAEEVTVRTGVRVAAIDRAARTVVTDAGEAVAWDRLILATGSRVRRLPIPGADLSGVHYLRTVADVDGLRAAFRPGARLVIVGCGYIGLEVAAVAANAGLSVTAIEAAPRVLARVAGPEISAFYEAEHRAHGVDLRTGTGVAGIVGEGRVSGVALADGATVPADIVLIGVGIVPNQELAADAGITCNDGIVVDDAARTSDPGIYAIGDCSRRTLALYDRSLRLESVHNAIEQAKLAAADILQAPAPALETPWFWSDQYDLKLQTAGLSQGYARTVVRGNPTERRFAVFYLGSDDRVLAVDAVNSGPEFLAGKQIVGRKGRLAPDVLADTSLSMKEIAARAA
jgi:3-phenylpropionate/trans-cinnamate dioxygenase ferredoxin reductase subunit